VTPRVHSTGQLPHYCCLAAPSVTGRATSRQKSARDATRRKATLGTVPTSHRRSLSALFDFHFATVASQTVPLRTVNAKGREGSARNLPGGTTKDQGKPRCQSGPCSALSHASSILSSQFLPHSTSARMVPRRRVC
jgi:hypothetical protein